MKIGDHIKAVLFILPLTERLTEPLFPDFKKSRILDTVLHYFHRSLIWLFSLEALPNKPWIKPHQKPLLRATEHWPTLGANWCWQKDYRHKLGKALHCLEHYVLQGAQGPSMHLSLSWVGFRLLYTWSIWPKHLKSPNLVAFTGAFPLRADSAL